MARMNAKKIEWEWLDLMLPRWGWKVTKRVKAASRRLKPNMLVRHGETHTLGEVINNPDNPKRIAMPNWVYVHVRIRLRTGKRAGSYVYRLWKIENIQIPKRASK